jgi:hypothetical protein
MIGSVPAPQGRSRTGEVSVLVLAALLLVAGMIWISGLQEVVESPESVGSSVSDGRRGALALYEWLDRAGFDVQRVGAGDDFPPGPGTMLSLNPNTDWPEGQAGLVRDWVERGSTLIVATGQNAGDQSVTSGMHPLLKEFGVGLEYAFDYTSTVPLAQPMFVDPPVDRVKFAGVIQLSLPVTGTTVLVSSEDGGGQRVPLAAMVRVGDGTLYIISSDHLTNNSGIREESNGAFVYNLVQMAGSRRVYFDEAHHGVTEGGDLVALLTSTPWGWALIYAALLAGAYYLWSARRLGPPLPVWTPDRRRPTSDYVRSVASLFRRARKPGWAAERYLQYFKRTLAAHAELDPFLTDERFVQALAERGRHTFPQADMLRAIERLRQLEGAGTGSEATEQQTLAAIRDAERVRRQALGLPGQGE